MRRPVPEVTKRDGRREAFEPAKIVRSVHRAAMAAGVSDDLICEELAAAATLVLEQRHAGAVPSTADLRHVVESVLMETGHTEVARQFILYPGGTRNTVGSLTASAESTPGVSIRLAGQDQWQAFQRHELVADLVVAPSIDAEQADLLARAVEEVLSSLPWNPIEERLFQEVVVATLQEHGFGEAARTRHRLGMVRSRVESLLAQPRRPGRSTESRIGEEVLRQHGLEDLLPANLARAHCSGDLEVDGLATPGRALSAIVSFHDVMPVRGDRIVPTLVRLQRELGEVLCGPLTLARVERPLALAEGPMSDLAPAARTLLLSLAEGAAEVGAPRSSRTELLVGTSWSSEELATLFHAGRQPDRIRERTAEFCRALVREASQLATDLTLPRLRLLTDPGSGEDLDLGPEREELEQAGILSQEVGAVEVWPLRMVGARVGINVARLALRTGRRRERAFLSAIREATQVAVAACACRLRELMARDDAGQGPLARLRSLLHQGSRTLPFDLPGRHTYHCVLIPVGLAAAVRAVTEYDIHESERARELQGLVLDELHQALPSSTPGGATFEIRKEAFGRAERRFGRQDFEAYPRGRDILRLSHDGDAYRYASGNALPAGPSLGSIAQENEGRSGSTGSQPLATGTGTTETAHPGS